VKGVNLDDYCSPESDNKVTKFNYLPKRSTKEISRVRALFARRHLGLCYLYSEADDFCSRGAACREQA